MAKPRRGDTLELVVDDLAFGGEGVGRADGYVVFVRGGLPGDRLRVTVTEGWVGRKLSELEAASGARAAWLVRFGEAELPTAGTVLQDGDQLVVAVTDEITGRVHDVVERAPEGAKH